MAAEDEEASNLATEPGGSLLELERYHAGQRRKLLVLQLVATLCENVSDTVFTDIAQVGLGKALGGQGLGCQTNTAQCHRVLLVSCPQVGRLWLFSGFFWFLPPLGGVSSHQCWCHRTCSCLCKWAASKMIKCCEFKGQTGLLDPAT